MPDGMVSITHAFLLSALLCTSAQASDSKVPSSWTSKLQAEIELLDKAEPGELGIYIKKLGDDPNSQAFNYQADRSWYLASTVKVPIAVVLLKKVEGGSISLDEKLTLKESDYVDGSGDLFASRPGEAFTISTLLEKMLTLSDSTATDMLIRRLGEDEINTELKKLAPGFGPFTTLLQVRHEAYGELHEKARGLTNWDFIDLKKSKSSKARLNSILGKLKLRPSQLKAKSIDEAFERYYARSLNAGTLTGFGILLEKLASGTLLSPSHTQLMLKHMQEMKTGENRLKPGLPKDLEFAQKTGTQHRRICNVGIAWPKASRAEKGVVIAACVEKFADPKKAEASLKKVGEAIGRSGVF